MTSNRSTEICSNKGEETKLLPILKEKSECLLLFSIFQTFTNADDSYTHYRDGLHCADIFDVALCHSNSMAMPVQKVHLCRSERNKEMTSKMAASTNDLLRQSLHVEGAVNVSAMRLN